MTLMTLGKHVREIPGSTLTIPGPDPMARNLQSTTS